MAVLPSSVYQLATQVVNPAVTQVGSGQPAFVGNESNGSLLVSETHGRYGASAARGNHFFCSSGLAGSVVKLSAATLTSINFSLLNPVGSGKNLELDFVSWQQFGTGTEIVSAKGLAFQTNIGTAGVPTTLTAGVINNALIGGGMTSVATFYTVATMTNAAIGATFVHFWLSQNPLATTVTQASDFFDLGGKLVMPPGTMMAPVASITGTHIQAAITVGWSEYPVAT